MLFLKNILLYLTLVTKQSGFDAILEGAPGAVPLLYKMPLQLTCVTIQNSPLQVSIYESLYARSPMKEHSGA